MAESIRFEHDDAFARIDADFAPEVEVVRDAALLPTLSRRLRSRVLGAATSAFQQARRWTQVRQAAAFLSICLATSLILSPLPSLNWPTAGNMIAQAREWVVKETNPSDGLQTLELPTSSAWALRDNREFLGMTVSAWSNVRDQRPTKPVALASQSLPAKDRLAALRSSDGWATVEAFRTLRDVHSAARHALQLTN